jgi:hydroxypyruvate reductase
MTTAASETKRRELHDEARRIFHHALRASSIPAAFDRRLRFEGQSLFLSSIAGDDAVCIPLAQYDRIHAVALGKAALPMLETLRARLPNVLAGGVCCAPSLPVERDPGVDYYAGGHPLPSQDSFASACAALQLLRGTSARDFVFFLISGGGSAMFELPLDPHISLDETRTLYQALVGSGATIAEINTVRKHFSAVKGGRLAAAAPLAARFSLLVSDVAPRYLDALASGPTLPDSSTVAECREIIHRYRLAERFPPDVRAFFDDPNLPETPALTGAAAETLLSSDDLIGAAREMALALGYEVIMDTSCDDWDYGDASRYLLDRFYRLRREHPRLCLLSGGEVTVRLGHEHGAGGRNQQFALACALELGGHDSAAVPTQPIVVLSAGSDGIDGNSDAAGAIADATTVVRSQALGIDPASALARFDAYPLFTALGDTLVTGPTDNNLRDLRILLTA